MTTTHAPAHSFTRLLARYINGGVDMEAMDALCDMMEVASATPAERLAFARFFLDASDEVALPRATEFAEIVGAARA